ncbi:MAG: ADP-ribosylation factor-like protein [Candidatus Heimdallarchaeaceae archaeon]
MNNHIEAITKVNELVSNPSFLTRLQLALNFQQPVKKILEEIPAKFNENYTIGISILDGFGHTIESIGSMVGTHTNIISFGEHDLFYLAYSISKKISTEDFKILILGESRCGKTSIIHRLNYNDFMPTKLHSIGLSRYSVNFSSYRLDISEIGGNIDLLLYFLRKKTKNNYNLIFFVLDNSFIHREQLFYPVFHSLSEINNSGTPVYFIKTKSDQKTSDKNLDRIRKIAVEGKKFSEDRVISYSAVTNINFQSILDIIFANIKKKIN